MKKMKLVVAGAVLACSISATGAVFAKEVEGIHEAYYGNSKKPAVVEVMNVESQPAASQEVEAAAVVTNVDYDKLVQEVRSSYYGHSFSKK